jgi:hypothetical protein
MRLVLFALATACALLASCAKCPLDDPDCQERINVCGGSVNPLTNCEPWQFCVNEECKDCGATGAPCCPRHAEGGDHCTIPGEQCVTAVENQPGICMDCGGVGEDCCPNVGDKCPGDSLVCDAATNTCVNVVNDACGGETEAALEIISPSQCIEETLWVTADSPTGCAAAHIARNYGTGTGYTSGAPNAMAGVAVVACANGTEELYFKAMTQQALTACQAYFCPGCTWVAGACPQ